jgi:hypothetical protein
MDCREVKDEREVMDQGEVMDQREVRREGMDRRDSHGPERWSLTRDGLAHRVVVVWPNPSDPSFGTHLVPIILLPVKG